jgi:hypothetical protein
MLNETLATNYFKQSWRYRIYVERVDDNTMLVCDGDVILKVAPSFKLFNDRSMFPELPAEGECCMYSKTMGNSKSTVEPRQLIERLLRKDIDEAVITSWVLLDNMVPARLLHIGDIPILIRQQQLVWFDKTIKAFSDNRDTPVILTDDWLRPCFENVLAVLGRYKPKTYDKFPAVRMFSEE